MVLRLFCRPLNGNQIDLLLVTHFHLDHAASLPYLTEKTGFKGRVFCTHPTKAVMRMLLADYIRLVNVHTEDILYDEKVSEGVVWCDVMWFDLIGASCRVMASCDLIGASCRVMASCVI